MLTVTAKNHAALFPRFEAKFSSSKENLTTKSGSVKSTRTSFCEAAIHLRKAELLSEEWGAP